MATYKVIQDIEAEDKFIGPLTLKQFVFAMAGAFFVYIAVFFARVNPWLALIWLPAIAVSFFMAIPWSKNQPTEVWVLAKLRFRILPKKRLWNQSGLQDLVTITVPKQIEKHLTKELTQDEVKGRLKILADTIDSRGWAVKHIHSTSNDRLIDPAAIPQVVAELDEKDFPDVLDEQGTPESAQIDRAIQEQAETKKQELYDKMDRVRNGEALESLDQKSIAVAPPEDEQVINQRLKKKSAIDAMSRQKLKTIPQVAGEHRAQSREQRATSGSKKDTGERKFGTSAHDAGQLTQSVSTMTTPVHPDIIEGLSRDNDKDLATLSRMAKRETNNDDEVVISLH